MVALLGRVQARLWHLTGRRWVTARANGRLIAFARWRRHRDPIVVFQMGKVASTTVTETIEQHAALAQRSVAHIHHLDRTTLELEARAARNHYQGDWLAPTHLWDAMALRRRLTHRRPGSGRWDVVTLVRDPAARNVSAFFQVAGRFGVDLDDPPMTPELVRRFYDCFPAHDAPAKWFDAELAPALSIDVYRVPFDHAAGFQIYEGERARLLVIRVEDLPRVGAEALGRFFKVGGVELSDSNIGLQKAGGDTYKRFLSEVTLSGDYLDHVYGSAFARHFYTSDEIASFRRRWTTR